MDYIRINMKVTKEDILTWLYEEPRIRTPYLASLHFNIEIEEFYRIVNL